MRVPPISTFGRFGVPRCTKGNQNTNLCIFKPIKNDTVSCTSTAKYLKKYVTLPDEIKQVLTPSDAIDMFKDMEWLAQGRIKRGVIGEGKSAVLYDNPWLEDYYLLILKDFDNDGKISVYSDNELGYTVWQDDSNAGIQLLKRTA